MIGLGSAGFLLGAAAIGVPVVLHLLRRKPTEAQPFPSFHFLHKTVILLHARNRLRKWLVLLLRCLALIFLALAFCLPYSQQYAGTPDSVRVLLVDNSLSMSARSCGEELQKRILVELYYTNRSHPAVLGLAGETVRFSGDFTGAAEPLLDFYRQNTPGYTTSRLGAGLEQANLLLKDIPASRKEIIVFTDGQKLPWRDLEPDWKADPGVELTVVTPARPGFSNAAVVGLEQETQFIRAGENVRFRVKLLNDTGLPVTGQLVMFRGEDRVLSQEIGIGPQAVTEKDVELPLPELTAWPIRAELQRPDDISADNSRSLVVMPANPPEIALANVSSGVNYIRRSFAAKQDGAVIRSLDDPAASKAQLQILDAASDLSASCLSALEKEVRNGRTLVAVWDKSPQMRDFLRRFGVGVAAAADGTTCFFSTIDLTHPLFRKFLEVKVGSLYSIPFYAPPKVSLPPQARVVAGFTGGSPAVAEIPADSGMLVLIASRLDKDSSGWPLHSSFLPFMRELLRAYGAREEEKHDFLCGSTPPKMQDATLLHQGVVCKTEKMNRPGFYVQRGAAGERLFCANPDTRESRSEIMPAGFDLAAHRQPGQPQTAPAILPDTGAQGYWRIFMTLSLLMAVASLLLANRTAL